MTPLPRGARGAARWAVFVVALALVAVAGGLVITLSQRGARMAGTNNVQATAKNVPLEGGSELCSPREIVPKGSQAAKVRVRNVRPGGTLIVARIRSPSTPPGRVSRVRASGLASLELPPRSRTVRATVCLRNRGRSPISIAAARGRRDEYAAVVDGRPQPRRIRIEYLRSGRETWWELVPTIAHRLGVGRGIVLGSWTLWAALALMIVAWTLALLTYLRALRV